MKKADKKVKLRSQIILSAKEYKKYFAGKSFLYCYQKKCFEIIFSEECFLHLTGVATTLHAYDFYRKAVSGKLELNQFYFNDKHPFFTAKKKLAALPHLHTLTHEAVIILEELPSKTHLFKLGMTNIDFTIGIDETTNRFSQYSLVKKGKVCYPRSLRIKDKSIEKSRRCFFVDSIFSKEIRQRRYVQPLLIPNNSRINSAIESYLRPSLVKELRKNYIAYCNSK